MAEKNDSKEVNISGKISDKQIKTVQETYDLYAEEKFEYKRKEGKDSSKNEKYTIVPVSEFRPDLRQSLKKVTATVSKEKIARLANLTDEQKDVLFSDNAMGLSGGYSQEEKKVLKEKMDSWKPSQEIAEVNATIALAWINNSFDEK